MSILERLQARWIDVKGLDESTLKQRRGLVVEVLSGKWPAEPAARDEYVTAIGGDVTALLALGCDPNQHGGTFTPLTISSRNAVTDPALAWRWCELLLAGGADPKGEYGFVTPQLQGATVLRDFFFARRRYFANDEAAKNVCLQVIERLSALVDLAHAEIAGAACAWEDTALLERCLAAGADPTHTLYSALLDDSMPAIELCLRAGADPNGKYGVCPLLGCAQSRAAVERMLSAGADPEARSDDGLAVMFYLRDRGEDVVAALPPHCIQSLEELVTSVEHRVAEGFPCFHPLWWISRRAPSALAHEATSLAEWNKRTDEIVAEATQAIAAGASPTSPAGFVGLCRLGHAALVREALAAGADPNGAAMLHEGNRTAGRTPLEVATEHDRIEVIKLLLEAGALVHGQPLPRYHGMPVARTAAFRLCSEEALELLLAAGLDLQLRDGDNRTLLDRWALNGSVVLNHKVPKGMTIHERLFACGKRLRAHGIPMTLALREVWKAHIKKKPVAAFAAELG
ncbi:MAG: hypothetical protein KF764_05665 [Labilithrix sp.]|nr:hypothetical protein [Labilithrix sp.]